MEDTFAPQREVSRKTRMPRWYRWLATCAISLSFILAVGMLSIGAVHGHPVANTLARFGAIWLLPIVSYFDGVFAPLDGALVMLQPKFATLLPLSQAAVATLFMASISIGVGVFVIDVAAAMVVRLRNDRATYSPICW